MNELEKLISEGEAPVWMTQESFKTLSAGYMLDGETPRSMYRRLAKAAASYYPGREKELEESFFSILWKNWFCPASPVVSNLGTTRGLPISCNSIHVDDSTHNIFTKATELAMLSKHGAGVGIYVGDIRCRGSSINQNGTSNGVVPWAKVYDTTISSVSQGGVRRGAGAVFLPINHGDAEEFLNIRRPVGDLNRRCLNLNHGFCVEDWWMNEAINGDREKRDIWIDVLRTRVETGEPYLIFLDNINKLNPECYKARNLKVKTSNICTEITLFTDFLHTFVCCLSSLNLVRWEEWKDTNLPYLATLFLDAVLEEYIEKSHNLKGLENSRRSAIKGRALGLGVLGWHTLLQNMGLPFDSFQSMSLNAQIFSTIRKGADEASRDLAKQKGEPEWCEGFGVRNTHLMAIAPTVSNSTISGGHSAGIEPFPSNIYHFQSAKGTFVRKNKSLVALLDQMGKNTSDVWKSINEKDGSVQHLKFLSDDQKKVYLTSREINQHAIVRQAIQRQRWVDQAQSVNLFFANNSDPKYIHDVHLEAWKGGLKTLYYLRAKGVLKGDLASRSSEECEACSG